MRAHHIVASIRESISAGEYAPGQKLNEETLSTKYGISRNTLREAFGTLEGEKLVVRILYRGVFITSPDANDIRDLYTAREMIEPAALLWAEHLDIDELASIVSRARAAAARGDIPAIADANQEFHRQLARGVDSPSLLEIMDQLLARMRLVFLRMLEHQPDFHLPYIDVNASVVDLLQRGDHSGAAERMKASIRATREDVVKRLAELPPAGDDSRSGWL